MASDGARVTATPAPCPTTLGLGAIRDKLAQILAASSFEGNALRVNEWFADVWTPPCAFIGATEVLFHDFNYSGLITATVRVRLVVPIAAKRPAQTDLETILDAYYGALQSDTTLSGLVKQIIAVDALPILVPHGNQDLPAYECETKLIIG